MRQMTYFWQEIMLLVGNGSTGHQIREKPGSASPWVEPTKQLGL